jgi:hypothetical protein
MPEYRKMIDTPPVKLNRKDLEDLTRVFTKDTPGRTILGFSFAHGDAEFRADSLEDLFQNELPPVLNNFGFSVSHWADEKTGFDCGITLTLQRTWGHYHIHALDETWFKGKIQQINEFLKTRRPWYARFSGTRFAEALGGFQVLFVFALWVFLFLRSIAGGILAGLCLILLSWVWRRFRDGSLFPNTRIVLQDSTRTLNKETLLIIVTAALVIVTAVDVVITIIVHFMH